MNTITSFPSSNPEARDLLKRRHRWTRLGWPLAIANLGLLATLLLLWRANPALAQVQAWGRLPAWWASGVAASLFIALVFLVARRRTITQSARRLDAALDAKNRLETTALLTGADTPIAHAQRDETAEFLRGNPAPTHHWGLRILLFALCVFVIAHLLLLTAWTRPWQVAAQPAPKPTPPATPPKATIVWKKTGGRNQRRAHRGSPAHRRGRFRQRFAGHDARAFRQWRAPPEREGAGRCAR